MASTANSVRQLADGIAGTRPGSKQSAQVVSFALKLLSANLEPSIEADELHLADQIKNHLANTQHRADDAARFGELFHQLSSKSSITNRWAILHFLFQVGRDHPDPRIRTANAATNGGLVADSVVNSGLPRHPLPNADALRPVISGGGSASIVPSGGGGGGGPGGPAAVAGGGAGVSAAAFRQYQQHQQSRGENTASEITEAALLRDILFVFQGIDGRYIRFDPVTDRYSIDRDVGVPQATRDIVGKLAELGWLFLKVQFFIQNRSTDPSAGLVERALCGALHAELLEYFRLISVLEGQLSSEQRPGATTEITLRRLVVWTHEPLQRMQVLALLVDGVKGFAGGAIASAIHKYSKHGDVYVSELIKRVLTSVNRPIYAMLNRWIYHGELEDPFSEFFISEAIGTPQDALWEHKYSIRPGMLPTFITRQLADKILLIGKSINFIRQSCQDRDPLTNSRSALQNWDVDKGSLEEQMAALRQSIDVAYRVVSKRLLEVMMDNYKLMDHLHAARNYLLLGQGDFVRHLIDLLHGELVKPAGSLYIHNLTSTLETAVRATNAQYAPSDVLARLDAKLFEVSPGDSGWDVFSLTYRVDGPISAVFKKDFLNMYLKVFNFLWRAKRMEHSLSTMWCAKMTLSRTLSQIPGLANLMQQYHAAHAGMSHFVNEIQYYFMFEVLECSWSDLLVDIKELHDLDQLIAAHGKFLSALVTRTFLGEDSKSMLSQLRSIFDIIISFQKQQDEFYAAATDELARREQDESVAYEKTLAGQWGMTNAETDERGDSRKTRFNNEVVPKMAVKVQLITKQFQDMVGRFLTMLTVHKDPNLRFLSFRIDFNEFYKNRIPEYQDACSPFRVKRKQRRDVGPSGLGKPAFDTAAVMAGN